MTTPDPGLTAALLKIAEHTERLALVESKVTENLSQCEMGTAGVSGAVLDLRAVVEAQGTLLESLNELVKTLVPPAEPEGPKPYQIQPAVHWWSVDAACCRKAIEHLQAWVDNVYRPHYGHLAVMLAACWADHDLCLVNLDWLSELHSVLYFNKRTQALLTAQAEYNTRILPATAELLRVETSKCAHRGTASNGSAWRGAR